MPIPLAMLLSMQASGMIVDYLGTENQNKINEMGAKLQQAGLDAALQQTRLETEDATLNAMKNLRMTIGSQIATFAARGTSTVGGSAVGILNESQANFNADERIRRMNLLSRQNELKANKTISILQQAGDKSKLWQGFASRTLNRFPSTKEGWSKGLESFGLTSKE